MNTLYARALLLAGFSLATAACGDDSGGKSCAAGESGCACLEENACNGDLVCMEGKCTGSFDVGVKVSDGRARGCDVLVNEAGVRVADVTFNDKVKGTFVRESPRVAVSFISTTDAPIDASGIHLQVVGDDRAGVTVESVACADAAGKPLEGVTVSLN